ncbi:transcription factor Adf-1-like [Parasteatoda tepidariorum]|uniref:transcription factor Adf-1-like n=1 Tax=Parasteatoda tepidariorum TaxID=114398 RepID=UPI001C7281E3|nr:transcription factor Adf-1-like [Parasteatoda tepidariorum]
MEEQLIDYVRNSPWLYDYSRADFRDAEKKMQTWIKIAEKLSIDATEAKRKWKCLRASFVREKELGPSGTAAKKKVEWIHMKAMSFLHGHVREKRETYSNYEQPTSSISQPAEIPSKQN